MSEPQDLQAELEWVKAVNKELVASNNRALGVVRTAQAVMDKPSFHWENPETRALLAALRAFKRTAP